MSDLHNKTPEGVSRRTVTKAMAWAVPAVAVAATVPVASASCVPTIIVDAANSCKVANDSDYKLTFTFAASCPINEGCLAYITKIEANTGSEPQLWPVPAACNNGNQPTTPTDGPVATGTPIFLCDQCNMSNYVWVTWYSPCYKNGAPQRVQVQMPSFPSTGAPCVTPCNPA